MKSLSNLFRRKNQASDENQSVTHDIADIAEGTFKVAPKGEALSTPGGAPTNEKGGMPEELAFELGDFLKRIPVKFLKHGEPDPKREIRFPVAQISAMIAQGKTQISLSEIVSRCPDLFRDGVDGAASTELYFPWQKLARLLQLARPQRAPGAIKGGPLFEPPFANRAPQKKYGAAHSHEPVFSLGGKDPVPDSTATPREAPPSPPNLNARKMTWFNRGRSGPAGGVPIPRPPESQPSPTPPSPESPAEISREVAEAKKKSLAEPVEASIASPPKVSISTPTPAEASVEVNSSRSEKARRSLENAGSDPEDARKERAEFDAGSLKALTAEVEGLKQQYEAMLQERDAALLRLGKYKQAGDNSGGEASALAERLAGERIAQLAHGFEKQIARISETRDAGIRQSEELRGELERATRERDEIAATLEKQNAALQAKIEEAETGKARSGQSENARLRELEIQVGALIKHREELSDHLAQAHESYGRELAAARDQLAAAAQTLEITRVEASGLTRDLDALRVEREASLKSHGEAIAGHDRELTSLREQSSSTLRERDEVLARVSGEAKAWAPELETLRAERDAVSKVRDEAVANLRTREEARRALDLELAAVREQLNATAREREQAVATLSAEAKTRAGELEALLGAAHQAREETGANLSSQENARAAVERELAAVREQLNAAVREREHAVTQLSGEAKLHATEIEALRAGRDAAHKTRDEAVANLHSQADARAAAETELAAVREQLSAAVREREQAVAQLSGDAQSSAREAETLRVERDAASKERDDALAAAREKDAANEMRLAGISTDRDETMERVKALRRQLAQAAEERAALGREKEQAVADIKRTHEAQQPALAALTAERDRMQQTAASLTQQIDSLRLELENAQRKQSEVAAQFGAERESLRQKLTEATQSQSDQLHQLRRELELAQKFRTEVTAQFAAAREENKRTLDTQRQQLDDTTRKLSQRDTEKRDLQKRVESLNAERERLTVEKTQALHRVESRTRELESQVRSLTEKHAESSQALKTARQGLSESEARTRELATIRADRDTLRQQIANIHTTQTDQIRALEKELETIRQNYQSTSAELTAVRADLESKIAGLTAERDQAQAERKTAIAERDAAYSLPQVRPVAPPAPLIMRQF